MLSSGFVSGRHRLATGSSDPASVGFCVAKTLLEAGAEKVTIVGRHDDKVDQAADLLQPETMKELVAQTVEEMGKFEIPIISCGNGGPSTRDCLSTKFNSIE